MLRPSASQKIQNPSARSKSHDIANWNEPIPTPIPLGIKSQIARLLSKKDPELVNQATSTNGPIIVQDTRNKKHILDDYQKKFGKDSKDSILARKKGKISDDISLDRSWMRSSLDKWYCVGDVHLYNVITMIIKKCRVTFSKEDLASLRLVKKDYAAIVPKVICWLWIDFIPLLEPRLGYKNQECINQYRVEMASAAMIHFGLDLGKFVRFLSGEYTSQNRDVRRTLDAVRGHVNTEDYNHIKRILMDGCPAQLTFEEPLSNKLEFISHGNSKNFNAHPKLVRKRMNKEDRYSHLVPMDPILCKFLPYLCHTTQSIVIKKGNKNNRVVWDGSLVLKPTDIVMNQITPVDQELPVTFGHVKLQIYIDIYNTRISYLTLVILIALANIKACFQFARIHADLTGAFGFLANNQYNLATAMVFGSTASAYSWVEALTKVFANRPDLVIKHKKISRHAKVGHD